MRKFVSPALVLLSVAGVIALASCEDDDVGIPCQVGGGAASGVQINSQATDCRSRLCIRYAEYNENAQSLCTAPCDTADDCPDSSELCPRGFACVVGQSVEGGLQCCKLCVCKSDLLDDNTDPAAAACQGKPRVCPNL